MTSITKRNGQLKLTSIPAENHAVELEWIQMTCSPALWDVNVNRPSIAYIWNTFHTTNTLIHCLLSTVRYLQLITITLADYTCQNYIHLTASFPGQTTCVSRNQKGKTILDFNETKDDGGRWQWHQVDYMQIICTSLQTNNHASTLTINFL